MQGSKGDRGSETLTPENDKNIRFLILSNTGPDPLKKSQSYQASIQCWVIIGMPAKGHCTPSDRAHDNKKLAYIAAMSVYFVLSRNDSTT